MQDPEIVTPQEMIDAAREKLDDVIRSRVITDAAFYAAQEIITGEKILTNHDDAPDYLIFSNMVDYFSAGKHFMPDQYCEHAFEWAKNHGIEMGIGVAVAIIKGMKVQGKDITVMQDALLAYGNDNGYNRKELFKFLK